MASFASETMVRLRFQLNDAASVPAELIQAGIDDAHAELLPLLDPAYGEEPYPEALVLGETLLAGAHVYCALAAKDAHDQKSVVVGGQRIEAGERFASLTAVAKTTRAAAWRLLAPFLRDHPPHAPAALTDTAPVLGGTH
ncbi:MAG TPA: hypothetical protein PLJ71_03890 [Candidatus Hydrogenedentes bacterium]|nr:hypothetical protein [Candidatus Hydrogenedentota bacterium]